MTQITTGKGIVIDCTATPSVDPRLGVGHCHDAYEIIFLGEARGRYVVEGREYELSSGGVLVAKPFEYHHLDFEGEERYSVRFTGDDLIDEARVAFASLVDTESADRSFTLTREVSELVSAIFTRSSVADMLKHESALPYKRVLLSELVLLISSAKAVNTYTYGFEVGARVIQYLDTHVGRDVNLDFLSKKFFVSKYYLCRVFKKHNGISIHGYVTLKRIMLAERLLESGESAGVVAKKVGYRDYSVFYRAYTKLLGLPPISTKNGQETE